MRQVAWVTGAGRGIGQALALRLEGEGWEGAISSRTYQDLEEAMSNPNSPNRSKYLEIRKLNLHKMEAIPVCKIPKK